jgi:methyl-accepting chemotaxis protein
MKNWFSSYGIRARIIGLMCLLILPLIVLIQGYILPIFETKFYQNKKDTTRITVEVALGVVDSAYAEFKAGKITEEEAKQKALAAVGTLRYNQNEYYWINDFSPKMVMHPMKPDLIGKSLAEMKDPDGKYLFNEMVAVVKKNGAGFVEYM